MKKKIICFALVAISIVMSLVNVLSANNDLKHEIERYQSSLDNEETGSAKTTEATGFTSKQLDISESRSDETESISIETFSDENEEYRWIEENRVLPDSPIEFVQGDMIVYTDDEVLKNIPFETTFYPSYRSIYYWVPSFLIEYVDRDEFNKWYTEEIRPYIDKNIEFEEMVTVRFVKHFRISRDVFDKACQDQEAWFRKLEKEKRDNTNREEYERYNADIIYTFDNGLINDYYRR